MNINDLIKELENLRDEYGTIDIMCFREKEDEVGWKYYLPARNLEDIFYMYNLPTEKDLVVKG